ncbi:elongation factor P hydroxylase [Ignatzschineria cameli]|uniref:Elongation factor P hydroxylase n=1 Tax=Ignatzschineria cameli TaxID=2182793 RepID=A0A2U2ASV0_9GAMM|nr:elongation factor P hydroxylase [Ignatzschineria cameli]PWD85989.1 elongation factor P hydroxylase [Ignatzschineria cameli]PWD87801.1 elongation factor P hydroxylase [Ignatzschineria cameli]PWD89242.1 elongation factor P hydroxylase [Ignatzschineria cameli]PWD90327.1 elongation factor P hydroxylase [Ignatzschineria cameli]PWD93004.1 elongation factor P hydroxylase [Ignatzschineria cameli]
MNHRYEDLIEIFNNTFLESENTILVKGDDEPIYLPADDQSPHHRIIFAHGFFQSGLHEIAHWCIAGHERRKLIDFGYWYCPDGRDEATQAQFEAHEIRPQALEWLFSQACGRPFSVSCDNLAGDFEPDRLQFQQRVQQEVIKMLNEGIPPRGKLLITALQNFYQTSPFTEADFPYPETIWDL